MIIAIGNKARHGKDTAGEAIQKWYDERNEVARKHDYPFVRTQKVNFADALKKEVTQYIIAAGGLEKLLELGVRETLGGDLIVTDIPKWVTLDPNPQHDPLLPHGKHPKLLQWWGTDFRRTGSPNYWIEKWKEQVIGFKGISITCDMRFINEANTVKEVGGHTVNVTRLTKAGDLYLDPTRDAKHISETNLDGYNFDFYIKVVDGHVALVEQYAVTLAEYLRQLES